MFAVCIQVVVDIEILQIILECLEYVSLKQKKLCASLESIGTDKLYSFSFSFRF